MFTKASNEDLKLSDWLERFGLSHEVAGLLHELGARNILDLFVVQEVISNYRPTELGIRFSALVEYRALVAALRSLHKLVKKPSNYDNNLISWLNDYKFSNNLKSAISELNATSVTNLVQLLEDPANKEMVRAKVGMLEYRRFIKEVHIWEELHGKTICPTTEEEDWELQIIAPPNFDTVESVTVMRYGARPLTSLPSDDHEFLGQLLENFENCRAKVAPAPFSCRAKYSYYGQLFSGSRDSKPQDVIFSRRMRSRYMKSTCDSELACHQVATFLAQEFNKVRPAGCPSICFADASVVQVEDNFTIGNQMYFWMYLLCQEVIDPALFEEYSSESSMNPTPGHVTNHDAVQAFSHWTHAFTQQHIMVTKCQGKYDPASESFLLAIPAPHCRNLCLFGRKNLGTPGMSRFFKTHVCNDFCRSLKLTHPHQATTM